MRADGPCYLPHEEVDKAEEDDSEEREDYVGHVLPPFKPESMSCHVDHRTRGY